MHSFVSFFCHQFVPFLPYFIYLLASLHIIYYFLLNLMTLCDHVYYLYIGSDIKASEIGVICLSKINVKENIVGVSRYLVGQ